MEATCIRYFTRILGFSILLCTHGGNGVKNQSVYDENKTFTLDGEEVFPYRVCGMSQATDIFRFAHDIQCTQYTHNSTAVEGMLLIYKPTIRPYIFPVRTYIKEVTLRYRYADLSSYHDLGESVRKIHVSDAERRIIDKIGKCYSAARYIEGDSTIDAFHDDGNNETVALLNTFFDSDAIRRFVTVDKMSACKPALWFHKTCTTVNCVVTDTKAKSRPPYHFFALSTGEIVDASPFYHEEKANQHFFGEELRKFRVDVNYTRLVDPSAETKGREVQNKVGFLEKRGYSISWTINDITAAPCPFTFWQMSIQAVKSEFDKSVQIAARELTATFISRDRVTLEENNCVMLDARKRFNDTYKTEYQQTHTMNVSALEIYKSLGGMMLLFQPLVSHQLDDLKSMQQNILNMSGKRAKRDVDDSASDTAGKFLDLQYAQLQYTYNILRDYINKVLNTIADAWCRDQKRTADMWNILSKVNPSAAVSAIYETPVSARYIGDLVSVSTCVPVNQQSVKIYQDLKLPVTSSIWEKPRCYTRPLVSFRFDNDTDETERYGQLGVDNEIFLGAYRIEECQDNAVRYFIAGPYVHMFQNHVFSRTVNLSSVEKIDTYIRLNISFLENFDFQMLRLYSKEEEHEARIFDLETLLRDFNAYKQKIYRLEDALSVKPYAPPPALTEFFKGMGAFGKGLNTIVTGAIGVMETVVDGVVGFFKNPFGGFTTVLIVGLGIFLAITVFMKLREARKHPVDYYFPYVNQTSPNSTKTSQETPTVKTSTADAYDMLKAIKALDEQERKKPDKRPNILERIQNRKYSSLNSEDVL